jgi:hypothetical protein
MHRGARCKAKRRPYDGESLQAYNIPMLLGYARVADTAGLGNVSPTTVSRMVGAARRPVAPIEKVVERQVKKVRILE